MYIHEYMHFYSLKLTPGLIVSDLEYGSVFRLNMAEKVTKY